MDDFVIVELRTRGDDDGTLEELLAAEGLRVGPTTFGSIRKSIDAEQVTYLFVTFAVSVAANLATPSIRTAAGRALSALRQRKPQAQARIVDDPPFNPEDLRPDPEWWGSE
jgi:hypothetical protein